MGQEWAASSPFQFFTDHNPELGRLVTEGRRREFSRFSFFADAQVHSRIPDPQDSGTFERSRLRWEEREIEPHASTLRYYGRLLALRRSEAALAQGREFDVRAISPDCLLLRRHEASGSDLLALFRLRGAGTEDLRGDALAATGPEREWAVLLTSEESAFARDASPPRVQARGPAVEFLRPGAVIFKAIQSTQAGGR
jgi:maltooligosyltrehalose trehalohydrolase